MTVNEREQDNRSKRRPLPITLELPDGFLEAETRCGFQVDERRKRIWAIELDLLEDFLRICKKYGIKVQVFAGTLLGAVRHKGFIPWDDDVDVWMTQSEFRKLLKVPKEEFKYPRFLQTAWSDPKYFMEFARYRNSETTGIVHYASGEGYNQGIYIDVFVLNEYPERKWQRVVKCVFLRIVYKVIENYTLVSRPNDVWTTRLFWMLMPVCRLLRRETWMWCYFRVASMFKWRTKRLGYDIRAADKKLLKRYWMLRHELDESVDLQFENLVVPAPKNYEEVLSRIYGDYMQLPPVESRGVWHEGVIEFDPDVPFREYFKRGGASK